VLTPLFRLTNTFLCLTGIGQNGTPKFLERYKPFIISSTAMNVNQKSFANAIALAQPV
jgi:hypothetical protein